MDKKKILAIDDNAVNLATIEQALQAEYEVVLMTTGKRALKYLNAFPVDLILLDVQMPDMDGVQTLTELRKLPNGASVPVCFLSATNDPDTASAGKELGILDYICKPFDSEDLKRRIQKLLGDVTL